MADVPEIHVVEGREWILYSPERLSGFCLGVEAVKGRGQGVPISLALWPVKGSMHAYFCVAQEEG